VASLAADPAGFAVIARKHPCNVRKFFQIHDNRRWRVAIFKLTPKTAV
jgi:hypothetical protein